MPRQDAPLASGGACAEGDSAGGHGEDVRDIEVGLGSGPVRNAVSAGRMQAICPRSGYLVSVGHLPELGRSRCRWMRVAVADWQGFRVQPEDRAELGTVDAGVADESEQFCILLE